MTPDRTETPHSPPSRSEVRQAAHEAIDRALVTRTVRGEATTGVNLSLLTDKLRAGGVPIQVGRRHGHVGPPPIGEVGRRDEGARDETYAERTLRLYGVSKAEELPAWATAPVKSVGGATAPEGQHERAPLYTDVNAEPGSAPRLSDTPPPPDAPGVHGGFTSVSTAEGDDGWKGTEPAEGTRRHLIRNVFLHEYGFGPTTSLNMADVMESALLQSTIDQEAVERLGEAPTTGVKDAAVDLELERRRNEMLEAHNELDRVSIPRAINSQVLTLRERVALCIRRVYAQPVDALLAAAQNLPEEDYRALERALCWDVDDLELARRLDEQEPKGDGLSPDTGQRIARALETLSATTGGALREILDRTAPDKTEPRSSPAASKEGMGT